MFDIKEYYREENQQARESYVQTLAAVKEVCDKTKGYRGKGIKKEYYKLLNSIGNMILGYAELEKKLGDDHFAQKTEEELAGQNKAFYEEILSENYSTCYANPAYAVGLFGDGIGQLGSFFYLRYRQYITYAFQHKIFQMEKNNRLFLDVFRHVEANKPEYEPLKGIITRIQREETAEDIARDIKERLSADFRFFADIVEYSDLTDLRYLYKYGVYISDNERETSRFLAAYPEEKIKTLATQIVASYLKGFKRESKDVSKKTTVQLAFNAGQERIVREVIKVLAERGLKALVSSPSFTQANRQYGYDHRFDNALYLDEAYVESGIAKNKKAFERCADILSTMSGIVAVTKFGETPFKPQAKPENLSYTPKQLELLQSYRGSIVQIQEQYAPQTETSFTLISLPIPEIGANFNEVFEDILEINMLDSEKYERIQQRIIDAMDKASYVHVKGKGANLTDIKINMQKLADPTKQTNFTNCGADVNIPVGEVFTSPKLGGTDGVLHVKETFLNGLRFVDLKLTFKDGYITDYNCGNFPSTEENKRYVKENLLYPHDTLPVGEFAIGTNTLAYVVAQKYKILDVLPALIIEKMGPHFAVGDTCFVRVEDKPVYNPDGKEITARENERSALRSKDFHKAYTHVHTDITLPYDSLGFITAVTGHGERIDIIKDGRFVLPGVEELNEPLDKYV